MNNVREYRMPLMIGAGALVVALLLWAILVSPQSSKLSSLQSQETQLQGQETALQAKLTALEVGKAEPDQELCRPAEDRHPDPQRAEPNRHRCRRVVIREPVQRPDRRVRRDPDPVQWVCAGHVGRRHVGHDDAGNQVDRFFG